MSDIRGSLDDTVPAERPITIDDLMTHRSGFAYAFSVPGPLARAYGKLSHRQDQDGWLADLAKLPLAHQPGARLTYSVVDRCARHRVVADRGQAAGRMCCPSASSSRSACPTPASASAPTGRQRAATMYQLGEDDTLHHDSMGPAPITDPPLCSGGAGPVVDGRRLSAIRADAARRRRRWTGRGCCRKSPPG